MKRAFLFFLILALVFLAVGCEAAGPTLEERVSAYAALFPDRQQLTYSTTKEIPCGLKRMKRLGGVDSSLNALPWRIDVIYVFTDGTERTVRLDGNRDHQAVEAWEQSLLGEGWIDG